MKSAIMALAAAAALAVAGPVAAATYTFSLTGDYTASWQLASSPQPVAAHDDQSFTLTGVAGTFGGDMKNVDMYYWVNSGPETGGLTIAEPGVGFLVDTTGGQLFSGSTAAPTFLTGTFNLAQFNGTGTYTLVIADSAAPVPESASWAMMIAGFGLTGAALRRRSRPGQLPQASF